jgi:glycosyltransferase involved in cell wall biosynthesis
MRILMLTPQIPYPPRQGTALRNWGILWGLGQGKRHEVTLVTFAAPDQPTEIPPALEAVTERVIIVPQPSRTLKDRLLGLLTSTRPDLAMRLESDAFRQAMQYQLARTQFDWVLVEGLEMAPYLDLVWGEPNGDTDEPAAFEGPRPRVAFDDHNCEYLLQRRAFITDLGRPHRWAIAGYSLIQWLRLRRFEREVCRRADLVVSVSETDAEALRHLVPGVQPLVMPNGIMVEEYATFEDPAPLEEPAFVFTGTMDFRPNVDGALWFVYKVWPHIRATFAEAHCYIAGQRPHRRLDAVRPMPGIIITGPVHDMRPIIKAATVYIVPLHVGGGSRLKILEAASMSKAIVSTTLGAEGFPEASEVLELADTPTAFAKACIRLARDKAAREALATRARAFASAYDWKVLIPSLLERLEIETHS